MSSHLRKHNHFRHGWTRDSRWTETTEGGAIPKNYSDWVEATARPTRWICGPTFVTAAIRLSRNIVIFQWKDEEWKQSAFLTRKEACEAAAAHPPLPLFLNSGVPNSAPFPHAWYRPLDVVWDAGDHRGGVARNTKTLSCKSWLPASSGAKSVKSFKSWLPPSTITKTKVAVSNKKTLSVSNTRVATPQTVKSCNRASDSQNLPNAVPCQLGTKDHVWTCPLCSLRIERHFF